MRIVIILYMLRRSFLDFITHKECFYIGIHEVLQVESYDVMLFFVIFDSLRTPKKGFL